MKKFLLILAFFAVVTSVEAQNNKADYDSAAKKAEAVTNNPQPQEKVFVLVGTETQFNFLLNLLSQTVLPITPNQSFSLLQWIGSRQQFAPDTKAAPKK